MLHFMQPALPEGGWAADVGRHGAIKPAVRARGRNDMRQLHVERGFLNARFVGRVGMRVISHGALVKFVTVAGIMLLAAKAQILPLPLFMALAALMMFAFGFSSNDFGPPGLEGGAMNLIENSAITTKAYGFECTEVYPVRHDGAVVHPAVRDWVRGDSVPSRHAGRLPVSSGVAQKLSLMTWPRGCARPAHDHWTILANSGQHTSHY